MTGRTSKGLEGVNAATTSISTVGVEGTGLNYRGYSVEDLADQCFLFEEVAFLLLKGRLPNWSELNELMQSIAGCRNLPAPLKSVLELISGDAHPMDVLRTAISFLGCIEPEVLLAGSTKYDEVEQVEIAIRLLGVIPGILLYWYNFHTHAIRIETTASTPSMLSSPLIVSSSPSHTERPPVMSIAEHWFQLLYAHKPDAFETISPEVIRALNVSLVLYAEHDLNASAFAARVTAATLSDFHSSVS